MVFAGVDYEAILRAAEAEADVILWDGGNNDLPFIRPNLFVVVADPLRPGHEVRYHPGETNLRMADVIVINKVDTADPGAVAAVRQDIVNVNPRAVVIAACSPVSLVGGVIAGKRVVVVEDGPTLTHGGMTFGAGIVAARRYGAASVVDPRPYAVGSLADVLAAHPQLEPLLPAMGYGPAQTHDLEVTLNLRRRTWCSPPRPSTLPGSCTSTSRWSACATSWSPWMGRRSSSCWRRSSSPFDQHSCRPDEGPLSRVAPRRRVMTALITPPDGQAATHSEDTAPSVPGHFLTLDSFDPAGLRHLLDLAHRAKRDPAAFRGRIPGGRVGMLFDKPSTRTRVSLEAAAWGLGMLPIVLRHDELQLGRGETVADTARALSRYLTALTVRTFSQSIVDELARNATIPIVNALTDEHHPCQALADLMTLEEEWSSLAGTRVAYLGDGNNVCHSLVQGAGLAGFTLKVATPPGYEPDAGIVGRARAMGTDTGGEILVTNDPFEALDGADAVYTDVWASMGREAERDARRLAFSHYRVDAAAMSRAAVSAIFLHCLPAHRGDEVTDEVIDGPQSRVWEQAENRLHSELALLYALITGDLEGHLLSRPVDQRR